MKSMTEINWIRIGLFNLFIVAAYGVIMRYKIAFDFRLLDQRNLQHAHSHFAFWGWLSLALVVLMRYLLGDFVSAMAARNFNRIFIASLLTAYGMLISFSIQGYGLFSIFFATISVILSFIYCWLYYTTIRLKNIPGKNWFLIALLFNILSSLGTFYLSYMTASHTTNQHSYLASVYWYLHFQYNGWFLFACLGLLFNYLNSKNIYIPNERKIFWVFTLSCVPAYGLSVLWLHLPLWIYGLIISAAILQLYGWLQLMIALFKLNKARKVNLRLISGLFLITAAAAFAIKIILQTASTIPVVSNLAFGFRPIVIAYLHLVLLGIFTMFLLGYLFVKGQLLVSKFAKIGAWCFLAGVVINEVLLALQGIFSLRYMPIPFINELLLGTAILLFGSIFLLVISQFMIRFRNAENYSGRQIKF